MESHGMPQAIIREEDDVQQIRAVRQQAADGTTAGR